MTENKLFIVANRLPISISEDKGSIRIIPSSGGLVSAVRSYLDMKSNHFTQVLWAGVPGCNSLTWCAAGKQVENETFTFLPVMVNKEQYDEYYNGFSNSLLWPLFHYFPSYAEYFQNEFEAYRSVNEQFLDTLLQNCSEGDTVWIHDYHLLPLAGMLRKKLPGLSIGFFLHIPFPSYELFRLLPKPWQQELLNGMLGADLIGFHTSDYAAHFLESVQKILGLRNAEGVLRYRNRIIKTEVFPISIDYHLFNKSFSESKIEESRKLLLKKLSGRKIIFSVDRLDYTKGVFNRLRAYQHFLEQNPDYLNKVVFILVIVPSRDTIPKYSERKRMIDELISQINSELGNIHWQPVNYQYQSLTFPEMLTLYTSCDVALITPLRDGMNLVAKEFVASRKDKRGVLVLSEMAGAAKELSAALLINPNDIEEISHSIKAALVMSEEEQELCMENMQNRIKNYNVQHWAEDFFACLSEIKRFQQEAEEKTSKRLLFFRGSRA